MLIIMNRHQADLNGFLGRSAIAIVVGISVVLVGAVFLVAACLHWRFCARYPLMLPVWRESTRFTFAWPEPATAFAVLSS